MLSEQQIRCLLASALHLQLRERAWLLDALTVCSQYTNEIIVEGHHVSVGQTLNLEALKYPELNKVGSVVRVNQKQVGIISSIENDLIKLEILSDGTKPCFGVLDVFEVKSGVLQNVFGSKPFAIENFGRTTVGRFIYNLVVLQYPFNFQVFPYVNKRWKPDDIVKMVKNELMAKKITVTEYEKFWDYFYFIGHITEIAVPSMTVKSLQTNPKVPELKRKFIEEHKDEMHNPLVVQKLEALLIEADKEYLGDDPSVTFFNGLGGKSFPVQRKKLFLTVGGIPAFGTDASDIDFIPNSLMEGWTKEALPSIANEIRKGSYERGKNTALGGVETKYVFRVFQDAAIVEDDCGTDRTIEVDCRMFDGKQFIGRTIRVGNVDVIVTAENLDKYVSGKVIRLYSPLTCATKYNFCYKCCGQRAKELGAKQLGVQTIKITSKFTTLSLKNMHGTALVVRDNKLEDILL